MTVRHLFSRVALTSFSKIIMHLQDDKSQFDVTISYNQSGGIKLDEENNIFVRNFSFLAGNFSFLEVIFSFSGNEFSGNFLSKIIKLKLFKIFLFFQNFIEPIKLLSPAKYNTIQQSMLSMNF